MDVRMPDGTIVKNVPDNVTQEDLAAAYEAGQKAPKSGGLGSGMGNMSKPDTMGQFGGILRGVRDPIDAGAQGLVRGANALGLAPGSEVQRVEGINKNAEKDYQENWRGGNAPPLDLMRIGGQGLVTGPLAAPTKIAPTLAGRMWQAGKAGMVGGGLTQVRDPQDNADFFKSKGLQIGAGGVLAAGGQPVVEGLTSGISQIAANVTGRLRGAMQPATYSDDQAIRIVSDSLAKQGIKFQDLQDGVKKSLVADVQEAMKKYGGVSTSALARQADFADLGIEPAKAWVSRDPVDFGRYKNAEGLDVGDPLKQLRSSLDSKLLGRLESLRGGSTGDAYQSGEIAGKALSSAHAAIKNRVTSLYDEFRKTAPNVSADPQRLVNTALDAVEKDALGDFLGPLKNLINDFATGKRPTTPDSLYRAQQVANAVVRKGGPEGMAARKIVEAIDNELEQMGSDMAYVGPEMAQAADLLKKARAAHRSLKMAEESIPALRDVAEGKFASEDFLNKYILGADVKEVASMWSKVDDPALKSAARSQIVDALKKAARGAGGDEGAVFRQDRFTELLGSPGMKQKLEIMLGKEGVKQVELVQRAAEAAIKVPSGARYNSSGSLLEMLNYGSKIPVVGPMIADPLAKFGREMQVKAAMKSGPEAFGQGLLDPFSEEMLLRSRRAAGLFGPAVGGAGADYISR